MVTALRRPNDQPRPYEEGSGPIPISSPSSMPPSSVHAAAPLSMAPAPSPFSLTPLRDDTALFSDSRIAFSHLLPGFPALAAPRPGDPPADVILHLRDLPLSIRYRVERLEPHGFGSSSLHEIALSKATMHASWRAGTHVIADMANPTWLSRWGVESAAVASYAIDRLHEDLFVLVKGGASLLVAWTCPREITTDPAFAAFVSVAEATLVWTSSRWEQRGRVWPDSAFLGRGIHATAPARYEAAAMALAQGLASAPLPQSEHQALATVLTSIVTHAGAPWVTLTPEAIAQYRYAILGAIRDPLVHAFVVAAFVEVLTAHDIRGLAILLRRAIG